MFHFITDFSFETCELHHKIVISNMFNVTLILELLMHLIFYDYYCQHAFYISSEDKTDISINLQDDLEELKTEVAKLRHEVRFLIHDSECGMDDIFCSE